MLTLQWLIIWRHLHFNTDSYHWFPLIFPQRRCGISLLGQDRQHTLRWESAFPPNIFTLSQVTPRFTASAAPTEEPSHLHLSLYCNCVLFLISIKFCHCMQLLTSLCYTRCNGIKDFFWLYILLEWRRASTLSSFSKKYWDLFKIIRRLILTLCVFSAEKHQTEHHAAPIVYLFAYM